MEAKVYKWAKGSRRPSGVSADEAARELERIRSERGRLTPDVVIAEAASHDAPLHGAFEWDDAKAGHQYRLQQARQLIRAVVTVEAEGVPEHRSYVLVKSNPLEEQTCYMPTVEVVTRSDLFGDALARLRAELNSAKDSVNEVVSIANAVNAAGDRREKLRAVGDRINEAVLAAEVV